MLGRFAALGAIGAALAIAATPAISRAKTMPPAKERYAEGGWKLEIRHDRFTGLVRCRLHGNDMLFQPAAVGFRFGSRRDTLDAWYRVDGGEPVRWQDRYPALIAANAQIDGPGLDNPTDGVVWVPLADLLHAKTVTVRASGHGNGRRFRMRGFAVMLDAAHRLGCTSDASFLG